MKHKFLFRTISALLSFVMLFGVFAFAPANKTLTVEAATQEIDDAYVQSRLDDLWNKVGGKYMTSDGNACDGSKCLKCIDIANLSYWGFSNTIASNQIPVHYSADQTWTLGTSCCGFANFVLWYENAKSSTDTVQSYKVASGTFSKDFLDKNAWVGDVIRIEEIPDGKGGTYGHSIVLLSWDSNGYTFLNSNRNYDCQVTIETNSWSFKWAGCPCGLARGTNRVHTTQAETSTDDPAMDSVDTAISKKIDQLYSQLGGTYFTTTQQTCASNDSACKLSNIIKSNWYISLFGNTTVSQYPNPDDVHYYTDGNACWAFAAFATWYIFRENNSASVVLDTIGTYPYEYSYMSANAKIGDYLRFDWGHSAIVISVENDGIVVLDSNYTDGGTFNNNLVREHKIKYSEYGNDTVLVTRAKNRSSIVANGKAQILDPVFLTLQKGQTFDFAKGKQGEVCFVDVSSLQWTSSDNSVATVDAAGKITAVAAGIATIKATASDGKYDECTFSVVDAKAECYEEWKLSKIQRYVFPKIDVLGTSDAAYCEDGTYGIDKDCYLYIVKHSKGNNNTDWGFGFAYHPILDQMICGWFQLTDRAEKTYDYLPSKPTATISRDGDQLTISWGNIDKATNVNIYKNGKLFIICSLSSTTNTFAAGADTDTYTVEVTNTNFPLNSIYQCKSVSDTLTTPEKAEDPIPDKDKPQYVVEDVTAFAGKTVDLYIEIANNPGIISLRNTITFDSDVLELVSVEDAGLLNGFTTPSDDRSSPYTLRWADAIATVNNKQNGIIVKLTFKVKENAEAGEYEIKVAHVESRDKDGNKYEFLGVTAHVEVVDYIVGDADGDGEISDWDAILFERYLAGWKVEDINLNALDVDGDSELSDWDAILLERYLAGWKVEF